MTKTCPKCGRTFECHHSSECWCSRYMLYENAREFLRTRYEDCLCEECLKVIIEEYK